MSKPGDLYAHDEEGRPLYWDPIKPPPRWKHCPRATDRRAWKYTPHYKPDDGAPCPYCGSPDKP